MSGPSESGSSPLVLVADDDEDVLELIALKLERAGYRTVVAANGEEALSIALDREPDVAVLDVMMPGLSGVEVTERLRAAGKRMPIMLLTARVREEDMVRGFEVGADEYMTKPFSPGELRTRVEAILERAR